MKTIRFARSSFALLLPILVLSSSTALRAQTLASTASLSGVVTDPSAARVAGASVTLTSQEKGISRAYKTDAEGNFSFPLLPAGVYSLTVQASGFKTFKQQGIRLEVGEEATYTATLTIGATEEVLVTTAPPLLQTENANIGAEISSVQVTELPLNLRNVFNFVELNSSVNNLSQRQTISGGGEQGTADQDVSFLNFGGGYFGTTAFLLDGAWDTSTGWGGVIYVPSPDNVQEFKVQQNSFSAQYGWSTGNVVNVVTKSGTRSLHGVAYDYLRNGALDANFYFNNLAHLPRPNSHRNQFGVAGGGPVYIPGIYKQRDKTFWFFQYEGHRENDPLAAPLSTTPIPAFRSGDFSALLGAATGATDALCRPVVAGQIYDPFSTRQVTATCGPNSGKTVYIRDPIAGNKLANSKTGIDPVGQKLVNYYPAPINNQVTNNWSGTGTGANNSDEFSSRIDHRIGDKTSIYGRYSYKKESKAESPAYFGASDPAGPGQINPNNRWNIALGVSQVFTPTFTMSVNLGGMKWIEGNNMQSAGFKPSSLGLPAFIDPSSAQFPTIMA
ncbi:MAG TPA: carboxypeptidase-like regulatory domain-containing protein, partial [Terriglobales bacterium]|nr:carboxypeptidase-like regulatory domain-containing protein [Terriglobales bacterium]